MVNGQWSMVNGQWSIRQYPPNLPPFTHFLIYSYNHSLLSFYHSSPMYIKRNFSLRGILVFSGGHIVWLLVWSALVVSLYEVVELKWLKVPWLPISLVGTAVAFYVGFKNNAAYDRMWEARKIWGAIVNDSRSLGIAVKHYIGNQFTQTDYPETQLRAIHQRMLYRHIGWLYTLRKQLLIPTPWEHISSNKHVSRVAEQRIQRFGVGLLNEKPYEEMMDELLDTIEHKQVASAANGATQLINLQAKDLADLRSKHLIDDFRHMEMQRLLEQFYTHQGKCERIKKYPLPRQYASMSFVFVGIFIFLLPFGMGPVFKELGPYMIWLAIPFSALVGWVFLMMELVGDYSENPFEGMGNDIPMMALSRTIEIDLREMLGEEKLPEKVQAVNNVLM